MFCETPSTGWLAGLGVGVGVGMGGEVRIVCESVLHMRQSVSGIVGVVTTTQLAIVRPPSSASTVHSRKAFMSALQFGGISIGI